jgi:hypothetical protein
LTVVGETGDGLMALPTFLLVGAQKSGTTTLAHDLAAHPEIDMEEREVHYFDRFADRDLGWYAAQFTGEGAKAIGESTPEYLFLPEVAPRIAEALPGVSLLVILRDPVDRAYSQYWHNHARGHEVLPFGEALAAEAERVAGASATARARWSYAARGMYAEQLHRLFGHVDRARVHVLLLDDLVSDRARTLSSVYRFVGVDESFTPPPVRRNPYYEFRSQRLRRPIRRLPVPLRRVALRLNQRAAAYPSMAPETRAALVERFRAPNAALAELLGVALPWPR